MRYRIRRPIWAAAVGAGVICAATLPVAFASGSGNATTPIIASTIRPANFSPTIPPTPMTIWHPSLTPRKLKTPAAPTRLPRKARPVFTPRHCKLDHDGDCDNDWSDYVPPKPRKTYVPRPIYGYYSCSMLEHLWISVGGNSASAFLAAEIATAESGGNPHAISPTNDYGLWQINGSWGALASLDPFANARAAVRISGNGSNWRPWTTYVSGAYIGRC
jgi:Lysozyme like domain